MKRVLIVDDEPVSRRGVRSILERETDAVIVGEAGGGEEAIELIGSLTPDLVYLDISMPEVDGFDVIEAVGAHRMPTTIFVTAHNEHALKAFEAHALDYILKPVDPERLAASYRRVDRTVVPPEEAAGRIAEAVAAASLRRVAQERLIVRDGGRIFFVRMRDIELIQSEGNYVRLTVGNSTYFHREPISRLAGHLPQDCFCQISRSVVINLGCVVSLQARGKASYLIRLRGGQKVTSTRAFRDNLAAVLR